MGRLTNPGIGDIVDRLTILSLKILSGTEQGKDTAHWRNEQVILLSQIRARTLDGPWFPLALDLAAVNGMLWHAEDDLRALRQIDLAQDSEATRQGEATAARTGFRIQELNDRRAGLIESINQISGDDPAPEKLT